MADDGIEQSGLHIWSFGELPESYEQKRGNYKVKAWPALVDERDSVAIKLFDNPLEQQQAMGAAYAVCCCSIFLHQLSICMRNCRIKPSWDCTLTRTAKCWS